MISNANSSKTATNVDFARYIGVGSVNIIAVNPNNSTLRKYGWNIDDGADEPQYANLQASDGSTYSRVRFLVQIKDLKDKPVIPMDFRISSDFQNTQDGKKTQIIDDFGRTAYATREEFKAHKVPVYSNGEANINPDYKRAHVGEADIITFLFKYLNITPFEFYDSKKEAWVQNKQPGTLTIDHWDKLCAGDVSELIEYVSMWPDNAVKVIFGVKTNDDNRTYQVFIRSKYISNGASPDNMSGEYSTAAREITRFLASANGSYNFSAAPIKEFVEEATEVKDASEESDKLPF